MLKFTDRLINGHLIAERNPQTTVHRIGGQLHNWLLGDLDHLIVARQPLAIRTASEDHEIARVQTSEHSVVQIALKMKNQLELKMFLKSILATFKCLELSSRKLGIWGLSLDFKI